MTFLDWAADLVSPAVGSSIFCGLVPKAIRAGAVEQIVFLARMNGWINQFKVRWISGCSRL